MPTAHTPATQEAMIRNLIDEHSAAIGRKDIDAALGHFHADVTVYDVVNPLRQVGIDGVRRRLEAWFAQFADGHIGFETRDLTIATGIDVAFAHGLNHVNAETATGQALDMWWRVSLGLRHTDDRWTIVHERASVPFDPETGQASTDLTP